MTYCPMEGSSYHHRSARRAPLAFCHGQLSAATWRRRSRSMGTRQTQLRKNQIPAQQLKSRQETPEGRRVEGRRVEGPSQIYVGFGSFQRQCAGCLEAVLLEKHTHNGTGRVKLTYPPTAQHSYTGYFVPSLFQNIYVVGIIDPVP